MPCQGIPRPNKISKRGLQKLIVTLAYIRTWTIKEVGGEGGGKEDTVIFYPKSFLIYFRTALSFAGGNSVVESQSLTVLSLDADATSLPSDENATP